MRADRSCVVFFSFQILLLSLTLRYDCVNAAFVSATVGGAHLAAVRGVRSVGEEVWASVFLGAARPLVPRPPLRLGPAMRRGGRAYDVAGRVPASNRGQTRRQPPPRKRECPDRPLFFSAQKKRTPNTHRQTRSPAGAGAPPRGEARCGGGREKGGSEGGGVGHPTRASIFRLSDVRSKSAPTAHPSLGQRAHGGSCTLQPSRSGARRGTRASHPPPPRLCPHARPRARAVFDQKTTKKKTQATGSQPFSPGRAARGDRGRAQGASKGGAHWGQTSKREARRRASGETKKKKEWGERSGPARR